MNVVYPIYNRYICLGLLTDIWCIDHNICHSTRWDSFLYCFSFFTSPRSRLCITTNEHITAFFYQNGIISAILRIFFYRLTLLRLNYPNALAIPTYLCIRQKLQKSSFLGGKFINIFVKSKDGFLLPQEWQMRRRKRMRVMFFVIKFTNIYYLWSGLYF